MTLVSKATGRRHGSKNAMTDKASKPQVASQPSRWHSIGRHFRADKLEFLDSIEDLREACGIRRGSHMFEPIGLTDTSTKLDATYAESAIMYAMESTSTTPSPSDSGSMEEAEFSDSEDTVDFADSSLPPFTSHPRNGEPSDKLNVGQQALATQRKFLHEAMTAVQQADAQQES